jgi:PAS domain S-box-containing protein
MNPQVRHFTEILPEPSLLVTVAGEVLFANDAAGELTGLEKKSLVGVNLNDLLDDPASKVESYLKLCAKSRQLVPGALNWRTTNGLVIEIRCDGTVIEVRTESSPAVLFLRCRPKAEATDHFVLLNQKIAALSKEVLDRKKAEHQRDELLESERAARIEAERSSRMKDEFLATLSHELRTPLNAILGWTQILEAEDVSREVAEAVGIIGRNARVQKQLIEDLLDMSRIISGKIRLDVQIVDLASVIEAAVATIRPAAEAKGVRLQLALDPVAGPVKGDPGRLQQVLWNLLSNAVKFTPKGGRVQIFLERVNSHLEIMVADTGAGVKPEFLPHVFDRFRQSDSSISRQYGGLGLGLSIVKQLVELHGGSVRAKSPGQDKGTTFVVDLPLMLMHDSPGQRKTAGAARTHPAALAMSEPCLKQDLAGLKVLVVDDESDARELIKRLLENCDAVVQTAASAEEALQCLARGAPDVLVSDIGMARMDGYEFIRRVRTLPAEQGGKVPAVALTAFARSEDRTRALISGYNIHLSKPLEPSELVVTVASLAGRAIAPPNEYQERSS